MPRRKKNREAEVARELRNHLELEAEDQRAQHHLTLEQAERAAALALGNTTVIQENTREVWTMMWLDRLQQDVRYAARTLKNNPAFAITVVLTAALGIGANTATFSLVYAVLLRPLPFPAPDRLVTPVNTSAHSFLGLGIADFQYGAWKDGAASFESVAAHAGRRYTLTGKGEPEEIRAQIVTPGFLRMLGVQPMIGRDFAALDAAARGGRVVIVTYDLWVRRFGQNPNVLSQGLMLNGQPYSIAGVLPKTFEFPGTESVEVLIAMTEPPAEPGNGTYFYNVIGRVRSGVSLKRLESELETINARLRAAYPRAFDRSDYAGARTVVYGLQDKLVGNVRPALLVLAGSVGLVLLLVCANLCNLLISRAIERRQEIAIRVALGVGRGRVLRQLLTEGLILAGCGGVAGWAVAVAGVTLLRAIAPASVPHLDRAEASIAVLAFNAAITIGIGILFGLAPIQGISQMQPETALRQTVRTTSGDRTSRRWENFLAVAETALAVILLAGAGLLIRSFFGLTSIPTGFDPENVLTARITLPYWKYGDDTAKQRTLLNSLLERVRSGPGVETAAMVACLPYGGFMMTGSPEIQGKPQQSSADRGSGDDVPVNFVTPDYFRVFRIPIRKGRVIEAQDHAGQPRVAVVNETFARRFFPGTEPVGASVRISGVTEWLQIVGVVGDVKQGGLASEPRPEVFQSAEQSPSGAAASTLIVRSSADHQMLVSWLRSQIGAAEKDLPLPEIASMKTRMAALIGSHIFVMRLLMLFAGVAVTVAAIGIYSVLTYSVRRRFHEIGIRFALGARRTDITQMVLRRGLRLCLTGVVVGLVGALALTGYLRTLLYGITPHDPTALGVGCLLLIAIACGASYLPARVAASQDSLSTLRAD